MRSAVGIALSTYLVPMSSTRAFRVGLLLFFAVLGFLGLSLLAGFLSSGITVRILRWMHRAILFPGLPVAAILVSEMSLRDGIRNRTLLYPLLGPVPRITMALVRTTATAGLLTIGTTILVVLIRLFAGSGLGGVPMEILTITLGSLAYVALFGLVHILSQHGLIAGLVIFLIDFVLSMVPLAIRNLTPSYHMLFIVDRNRDLSLPFSLGSAGVESPLLSITVLLLLAVVFSASIAIIFKRKNLGELC